MSELLSSTLAIKISSALIICLIVFTAAYYGGDYFDNQQDEVMYVDKDPYEWTLNDSSILANEIINRQDHVLSFGIYLNTPLSTNETNNPADYLYDLFQGLTIHRNKADGWLVPSLKWVLTGYRSFWDRGPQFESYDISDNQMENIYSLTSIDIQSIPNLTFTYETDPPIDEFDSYSLNFAFDDGSQISFTLWGTYLSLYFHHFDRYEYSQDYMTLYQSGSHMYYIGSLNHKFNATTDALNELASQFS